MPHLQTIRRFFLTTLSVVIIVSICIQFTYGLQYTSSIEAYVEQFFSYFTILSNIFVAVIFALVAKHIATGSPESKSFSAVRGAAVFCILTTGTVYSLFLRGPGHEGQVEYSIAWINTVFHYAVPTIAVLDWLIFPPKSRLNWSTLFTWLGLTIAYLVLVEIAGYFFQTYPYFFLNPSMFRGYVGVLTASAFFLPFFLVFSLLVIASANIQLRFRKR